MGWFREVFSDGDDVKKKVAFAPDVTLQEVCCIVQGLNQAVWFSKRAWKDLPENLKRHFEDSE